MADIADVLVSLMGGGLAGRSGTTEFNLPAVGGPLSLNLPAVGGGMGFDLPAVGGAFSFALPAVSRPVQDAPGKKADPGTQAVSRRSSRTSGGPVPGSVPAEYQGMIQEAAAKYGVDPTLLAAQLKQESMNFDPDVVAGRRLSPAGAAGIAQFMPPTAAQYQVNVTDPQSSIDGMGRYMRDLLQRYGGNQREALAAYNGGDGAVQRLRAGTPYQETQQYLTTVTRNQETYRAENAAMAGQTIAAAVPNPAAQGFLAAAMTYQGVNYVWGGSSRSPGVDCSGLIIAAARDSGHPLPGRPTAQGIYNQVPKVDAANVQPGDLVFFEGTAGANAGERISHVGIVTEAGMMLNAPRPGTTVSVAPYNSAYWAPKIVGFGRMP